MSEVISKIGTVDEILEETPRATKKLKLSCKPDEASVFIGVAFYNIYLN